MQSRTGRLETMNCEHENVVVAGVTPVGNLIMCGALCLDCGGEVFSTIHARELWWATDEELRSLSSPSDQAPRETPWD